VTIKVKDLKTLQSYGEIFDYPESEISFKIEGFYSSVMKLPYETVKKASQIRELV
jgi:hypothetical protein